jgi:hypothetical protein
MARLWSKIMLKTGVEYIQENEGFYFYLYSFRDLVQKNFQRGFYVCIKSRSLLKTFLIESQLWINWNLNKT